MATKLKLTAKISAVATVEVIGDSAKDLIRDVAFFQELPAKCPRCGAAVKFTFREPSGYKYYGLECIGEDRHSANLGQKADGDALFYRHDEEWLTWDERKNKMTKDDQDRDNPRAAHKKQAAEVPDYSNPDEDLPF